MTLFVSLGESVEAIVLRLMSRAPIFTDTPVISPTLGVVTYPFRMTQNSEAEIETPLAPRQWRVCQQSHLDPGDMLLGVRIAGHSTKPLSALQLIQGTGAHKACQSRCKDFGYARLEIPLRNVLNRIVGSATNAPAEAAPAIERRGAARGRIARKGK
jgi:hypothetical protein